MLRFAVIALASCLAGLPAYAQAPADKADQASQLLVREKQLTLFETNLAALSDNVTSSMTAVLAGEIDKAANKDPMRVLGRDRPRQDYDRAIVAIKKAVAETFAAPPALRDGTFDASRPAPGDEAIADLNAKMKYRQYAQQFEVTRAWLDAVRGRLQSEKVLTERSIARFKPNP